MVNWKYNPEDYGKIKTITPDNYRVRIENAEEQVSKKGNDMIKLTLKVSGFNQKLFEYIVFPSAPAKDASEDFKEKYNWAVQKTNDRLGQVFDSFNIEQGNLNVMNWQGKVGAVNVKHQLDAEGNMQARVNFFIKRNKQDLLPAWQENPVRQAVQPQTNVNADMVDPNDNDCPF